MRMQLNRPAHARESIRAGTTAGQLDEYGPVPAPKARARTASGRLRRPPIKHY